MSSSKDFSLLEEQLPPESLPIEIYEGLSHPFFEQDQLINEVLFGSRKVIHGHGFQPSLIQPNIVTEAIVEGLWSKSAFSTWVGSKLCGGFHADYCLRWIANGIKYDVMICLGCCKSLIFRDGEALRCDIRDEFCDRLHDLAYPD